MQGKLELLVLASVLLASPVMAEPPIIGYPRVVDGDSLAFDNARVRLIDIDAPETAQICKDAGGVPYQCGVVARLFLTSIINNDLVTCWPVRKDRYDRWLSNCSTPTVDLESRMVQAGWAVVWKYKTGALLTLQANAERARVGLWQGWFEMPWDWREFNRDQSTPTPFQRKRK